MKLTLLFLITCFTFSSCKKTQKSNLIDEITDSKELKKILRTKTNVLVCFISNQKESAAIQKILIETAETVKGQGTILIVDCSGEGKKMCKKLKVTPDPYIMRHYKDGEFHKNYDRKETVSSLVGFMRDPTGDLPWDEDDSTADIFHIPDPNAFFKFLKKETLPVMVMFYAPWCGFCKQLKPEYSAAATELKGTAVLAAVDVNKPENTGLRMRFNITGFPTLQYFKNGEFQFTYEGDNKKASIVSFMKNPTAEPSKPKEEDWANTISDVVHLTTETFDLFTESGDPVLVMFYAPWCGHCKRLKPEYEKAAAVLKNKEVKGSLAAVDATKEPELAKRFGVKSYPTLKFFSKGEYQWDHGSLRDAAKLVEFMEDPQEPPPPPPPEPAWEDQPSEVLHLNEESFKTVLKKKRHALVMFYAPWCGHCKAAKPEFTAAAEDAKDNPKLTYAAIDCTKHNTVCGAVGVNGYPTFKYYNYYNKSPSQDYDKGRKKENVSLLFSEVRSWVNGIQTRCFSSFSDANGMRDTSGREYWGDGASVLVHLSLGNFVHFLKKHKHSLIMFYHPSCPICLKVAPYFASAAQVYSGNPDVTFAVVNSYEETILSEEHGVVGYPSFVYYHFMQKLAVFTGYKQRQDFIKFMNERVTTSSKTHPGKEEL